jgi:NAD(P)-dependent dehydrogenase (short-subunit alcohol dehydrogenase family)
MARVFMLGATGTIGQATVRALRRQGHDVVCVVRPQAGPGGRLARDDIARLLPGATLRFGHVTDPTRWRATASAASASTRCCRAWPRAPARRATPGPSTTRRTCMRWPPRARPACAGGAAVGHLRAEAAAGLPAGQAGLRAGAGRFRA